MSLKRALSTQERVDLAVAYFRMSAVNDAWSIGDVLNTELNKLADTLHDKDLTLN